MFDNKLLSRLPLFLLLLLLGSCGIPALMQKQGKQVLPEIYSSHTDTLNSAHINWRKFFRDPYLAALIDTALKNNQELNIMLQEIRIAQNESRARKGDYLPFVSPGLGAGVDKVGRYTSRGANDANTEIMPGKKFPEPLPDFRIAANASWELDIWKKLRNARKAAIHRYLASVEGKNFMVTRLISEIAVAYYELLALDNQLAILKQNIAIQQNALEIVKLEKNAARTTELAVRRFEAEVMKNQSLQYDLLQRITETENRINFLLGRFPQPVNRNPASFGSLLPDSIYAGIPAQLLANRPDIRQAEQELIAAGLDVKVARANFYPTLALSGSLGFQAFNPRFLFQAPESILYSLAGEMAAPLINRNAIKAAYLNAGSRQLQAAYQYERTVLNAYIEVVNQLSNIRNLEQRYQLKTGQTDALTQSIDISTRLFSSARADYMEVLLTQRDALEARFELIEIKQLQLHALVQVYQALGGGWN